MYAPGILFFSWIYSTTPYDQRLISDDPAFFQARNNSWIGCPWTDLDNVRLWQAALRNATALYGKDDSAAKGLMCANWGGGKFEARQLPPARAMSCTVVETEQRQDTNTARHVDPLTYITRSL